MKSKSKKKFFSVIALLIVLVLLGLFGIKVNGKYYVKPIKDKINQGLDLKGGVYVVYEAQTDEKGENLSRIIGRTIEVFRKRIDGMGLTEPLIVREGENRIRIELPGVKDVNEAIESIGKTAKLMFVDEQGNVILDGSMVKESRPVTDNKGQYAVTLSFNDEGAKRFAEATKKAAPTKSRILIILDKDIISAPSVSTEILGGNAQITGNFDVKSASELSNLIQAGALPVDFKEVESSTKSAQLGDDALKRSIQGAGIGIALVMLFMILVYKLPGFIADIALTFYMLIFMYIYTWLGATLTLPGIAALILSVGMAVDANVIIFERIKEEILSGKTVKVSLKSGFSKALSTIMDSQITTIIAGVVLYSFGTGPIRGFAVTLILGILVSLFTAIVLTKFLIVNFVNFANLKDASSFGIKEGKEREFHFKIIEKFKYTAGLSLVIIVVGLTLGITKGYNMGIDFTGGTDIEINMHKYVEQKELLKIVNTFDTTASVDYLGDKKEVIQIRTTKNLNNEERKKVFQQYKEKFNLKETDFIQSGYIGASIGKEIQKKAVVSVILASLFMLLYISVRFKYTFGISAIIALLHDVLIVLAIYAIFKVPINSPFVASILTVVGYSINDTIVVFDRIREIRKQKGKGPSNSEIANVAINKTLTRSINTSITTLLAIISLYILGVDSIKEFTFPLLAGIISGTYSSVFIASPLWVLFEKRGKLKKAKK